MRKRSTCSAQWCIGASGVWFKMCSFIFFCFSLLPAARCRLFKLNTRGSASGFSREKGAARVRIPYSWRRLVSQTTSRDRKMVSRRFQHLSRFPDEMPREEAGECRQTRVFSRSPTTRVTNCVMRFRVNLTGFVCRASRRHSRGQSKRRAISSTNHPFSSNLAETAFDSRTATTLLHCLGARMRKHLSRVEDTNFTRISNRFDEFAWTRVWIPVFILQITPI